MTGSLAFGAVAEHEEHDVEAFVSNEVANRLDREAMPLLGRESADADHEPRLVAEAELLANRRPLGPNPFGAPIERGDPVMDHAQALSRETERLGLGVGRTRVRDHEVEAAPQHLRVEPLGSAHLAVPLDGAVPAVDGRHERQAAADAEGSGDPAHEVRFPSVAMHEIDRLAAEVVADRRYECGREPPARLEGHGLDAACCGTIGKVPARARVVQDRSHDVVCTRTAVGSELDEHSLDAVEAAALAEMEDFQAASSAGPIVARSQDPSRRRIPRYSACFEVESAPPSRD